MSSLRDFLKKRVSDSFSEKDKSRDFDIKSTAEYSRSDLLPDGKKPVSIGSGFISGVIQQSATNILYEISNRESGLCRALKMLKPGVSKDEQERFEKNFAIAAQLNHPNIFTVHSLGQWNGLKFAETEKIWRFTAAELISESFPLPLAVSTAAGIIICKVLEYMHDVRIVIGEREFRGFLHLDLSTSNLVFSDSGTLKVNGPGIAIPIQSARSSSFKVLDSSTPYSAPELQNGNCTPDERSDLFSLGCILYEMLSGKKPLLSDNQDGSSVHREIKNALRGTSGTLASLIESCISLQKENRPSDPQTVREQLELIHSQITNLSPESTISLFVKQRKLNEPHLFPSPVTHNKMNSSCISWSLIVISACILIFSASQETRDAARSVHRSAWATIVNSVTALSGSKATKKQPENSRNTVSAIAGKHVPLPAPAVKLSCTDAADEIIAENSTDSVQSKKALMILLRSLQKDSAEKHIADMKIEDGEYYFHKARLLFGRQRFTDVLENLKKADSIPSEFIDPAILARQVQLLRARTQTAIYRKMPSPVYLETVLQSWEKMLEINREVPDSSIIIEAEKEKRNLAAESIWEGKE